MLSRLIHIPTLEPDEQLEGLIAGSCSLYGITRQRFLAFGLGLEKPLDHRLDYDIELSADRAQLLAALNALTGHPLLRGAAMALKRRGQFCPLCFKFDRQSGNLPRFRLAWAQAFRTHCPRHKTPLLAWKYTDKTGYGRVLPPDILDGYLDRPDRLKVGQLRTMPDDYGVTVAQMVYEGLRKNDLRFFGYQQALHWERLLLQENESLCYPFMLSPSELRRVVCDLATAVMSTFDQAAAIPTATRLSWVFGPTWLFPAFKGYRSQLRRIHIVKLTDVEDPGVRRTVLFCVMRILLALTSEVDYSHVDGSIVGCSKPLTTKMLLDLPRSGKLWLAHHVRRWPVAMQNLFRHVLPGN